MQLLAGRNEDHPAAGISKSEGGLVRGERGVKRDGNSSEQQAGYVGNRPLGTIFAEEGDAITRLNAPRLKGAGSAGNFLSELTGRNGQPFPGLAIEHGPVEIALDGGEEDIVESGDGHRVVRGPAESRAAVLWELYCFLDAFGNVKQASHRYPSCFVVTGVR